jgi:transposase-like protein
VKTTAEERFLDKIRRMFTERRKQFGRKPFGGYPHSFRNRAVEAVAMGIAPKDVAKAAGVSEPSIRNWCKELNVEIELPTELKVVEAEDSTTPSEAKSVTALIQLRSGLRIEIPISGLSEELIKTLNGVAQ